MIRHFRSVLATCLFPVMAAATSLMAYFPSVDGWTRGAPTQAVAPDSVGGEYTDMNCGYVRDADGALATIFITDRPDIVSSTIQMIATQRDLLERVRLDGSITYSISERDGWTIFSTVSRPDTSATGLAVGAGHVVSVDVNRAEGDVLSRFLDALDLPRIGGRKQ